MVRSGTGPWLNRRYRPEDKEVELRALRGAYGQWSSRASISKDAAHATKVLGAMLRKVSQTAAADQEDTAPPATAPRKTLALPQQRRHRNREMPYLDHDYVSPPAPTSATAKDHAFAPGLPAILPDFLRQESERMPFRNVGLLSTMRFLDYSEAAAEPSDFAARDDLGSLIDNTNDIDWVSYCSVATPNWC